MSKFVGWGGLSQAFDDNNESWSKEYEELKELLTDEEYSAARATVNNAFYTSPEIASCMNQALVQFGFRSGNVLEPSMGIGNFFGSMPAPMQSRNKLYGVEIDSISGRIAKQLYQIANISITGFENTTYPDNFLMWLSEMCHLEITRCLIQSTTSITSVSTIISLLKHLIR